MIMNKLYRIEELCTSGWELTSEDDVQLSKEQVQERLNFYIREGSNPETLRVSLDV
jgi:hypothetical protein